MLGRAYSMRLWGIRGDLVEIETDVTQGLPGFTMVGLPDVSVLESRDRVRSAVSRTFGALPARKIIVNLIPASVHKTGTGLDLPVAMSLLARLGIVDSSLVRKTIFLGELGLDGQLRPVSGVLPAVLAAKRCGWSRVVVPAENRNEAQLVTGIEVFSFHHLAEAAVDCGAMQSQINKAIWPFAMADSHSREKVDSDMEVSDVGDMSEVVGQPMAKRALEVAAAGGHHVLLTGPPGTGKSMVVQRLPGILPQLTEEQAIEVTSIRSIAGQTRHVAQLMHTPPVVQPHHSATVASIVGGGTGTIRPGAVSLASQGVLFLDEAAEFRMGVLDSLRQPLETGRIQLHRAAGVAEYPAAFQLVLASNPCPCGYATSNTRECICSPFARRRYFSRLSGPVLDRIDLHVEVGAVDGKALALHGDSESSKTVAARVSMARERQRVRWGGQGYQLNSQVPGTMLRKDFAVPWAERSWLDRALEIGNISLRGYDRVLRTAWTLADLQGDTAPFRIHIDQALRFRLSGAQV